MRIDLAGSWLRTAPGDRCGQRAAGINTGRGAMMEAGINFQNRLTVPDVAWQRFVRVVGRERR